MQDIGVSDFLEGVITLMKPDLDHQGILVEREISPIELVLRADESLLQQVMINLFRNAADALVGTEDPVIRIAAYLSGERPVLSVSDNGTGIPPEIIDRIFTPFYTSKKEGSGIGLSFARQVMRMHHGRISAGPVPEGGSVFSLYF
jgi:C4-dicarboxylate-specific signal transduction histidine kinase